MAQQIGLNGNPPTALERANAQSLCGNGIDKLAGRIGLTGVLGHVGRRTVVSIVEKRHAKPIEIAIVRRLGIDILDDEEHLKLRRVQPRIVVGLGHMVRKGQQPQTDRQREAL